MGMFLLESLINRFEVFAINENSFKTLTRVGDGLFLLLTYTASVATSVIRQDASQAFAENMSQLSTACVFLWFATFAEFGHLFIMEGMTPKHVFSIFFPFFSCHIISHRIVVVILLNGRWAAQAE